MKKIFTLLFAAGTIITAKAQTGLTNVNGVQPVAVASVTTTSSVPADELLLILKETEFDFGKIPQGKPVTHVFGVMNKSKDSLKIVNVQASCGCTTPSWEKDKAIAPNGGNTQITVGYNAAAEGPFNKFITITYNGTQTKQITIKGEVWKTPNSSAPENKIANDIKN